MPGCSQSFSSIHIIFERVIYNQLYNSFVDNSLLTEHQFGFRAKHSTELATIRLVDYINKEMDKKHTPVNIYLDLSKAFDTINFEVLLYKMGYCGVVAMPPILTWPCICTQNH